MTVATLFRLTAAILVAAALGATSPASAQLAPTSKDLIQLNTELNDPEKAFEAVKKAQRYLKSNPDSMMKVFLHRGIINGMMTGKAPGYMLAEAADSALRFFRNEPLQQVAINAQVAQYLLNHRDNPKHALRMVGEALRGLPNEQRYSEFRGVALGTLGEAYLQVDKPDSAILALNHALALAPDSQKVLNLLGEAYVKVKKDDQAINAFSRALAVYLGADTAAAPVLRALWTKKHGSLKGLDAHVARLAESSMQKVALDARRYERVAPSWTLPDLDGKSYKLEDHRGKVVVLDFWGTWCGPCREELPIFQKVYDRYKDRVAFYGVNWERAGPGVDAKQKVRDYMAKFNYTFPVVLDHARTAQTAYDIEAFPTVYLIDKTGQIRYRNVGLARGIEQILTDQIESLLD